MSRFFVGLMGLGLVVFPIVYPSAATAASRETYRQRDAERIRNQKPAGESSVIFFDGTPPAAVAPVPASRAVNTRDARRRGGLSLLSGDGGPIESETTILGEAGMAVPAGGDDVEICKIQLWYRSWVRMDTASDGRLFVSVVMEDTLRVYESTDAGESWAIWSQGILPDGLLAPGYGDFEIAEGVTDRVFLAYEALGASSTELRIAYADINSVSPVWTVVTALPSSSSFIGIYDIDIDTDVANYTYYYVYAVATVSDSGPGAGTDTWFVKSSDMGSSYETPYRIADSAALPNTDLENPYISYGDDDWLHVLYRGRSSNIDDSGVYYRRASNVAAAGIASWQPRVTLRPIGDGMWSYPTGISASTNGTKVVACYMGSTPPDYDPPTTVQFSADHGATWPAPNTATLQTINAFHRPIKIATTGDVVTFGMKGPTYDPVDLRIERSDTTDLTSWSDPLGFTFHPLSQYTQFSREMVVDSSRAFQAAFTWMSDTATIPTTLRFDAEWRRDPGYGNTEAGFPLTVTGGGSTPPAIAEVDGDPEGEIVFATHDGVVHVLNHDGTEVPGWPQALPSNVPFDAPVAVGDLATPGDPYIVMGTLAGNVYAFDAEGNIRDGWPVNMSTQNPVFVTVGALGPPYRRYVVAACDKEIRILRYDGVNVAVGLSNFSEAVNHPCAIGDVDNDGVGEIVAAHGSWIHVLNKNQSSAEAFRFFGGETFHDMATLCDLDLDGDLEIAAPTQSGKMYMLHDDLTDVTGWPVTVASGQALSSAALAHFLAGPQPEVVFAELGGSGLMHMFDYTGTETSSYPESFDPSFVIMPPIVAAADPTSAANIVYATSAARAYSYRNLGGSHVGFPRNLPGPVEETPAAGDIDNDGRNEIVILGTNFLTVLDVGQPPRTQPDGTWRMYGHDAQRTGCLDCDEDVTTAAEDTPVIPRPELSVFPNPFNPVTTIEYAVDRAGPVSLRLYDVSGRLVDTIIDDRFHRPNRYSVSYDANIPSGVYFLKMETASGALSRKIVLLK